MLIKPTNRVSALLIPVLSISTVGFIPFAVAEEPAIQAAGGQQNTLAAERHVFQYAAKVICVSNIPGTSSTSSSVLPGNYVTAVNVHNPNADTVRFRKKIALTGVHEETGPISKWIEHKVGSDGAFRVGCDELRRDFGMTFIHGIEGFLVIESSGSLDVVAVYTAGPRGGPVESIAVERVSERVSP
jgi:hypothetical protein